MPPGKRRAMPVSLEDSDSDWAPSGERRAPVPRAPKARKASGSAAGAAAAPSPKKAKRPEPKPQPEKRVGEYGQTVRWVQYPSSKVQDRIERALPGSGHRLYLIQREGRQGVDAPDGPSEDFKVLGATGNVYDVTIGRHPTCSCPDFMKGNHPCKHVLFVMMRVLGVARSNPLLWQRALLTAEAQQVLAGSGRSGGQVAVDSVGGGRDVVASEAVRRRYAALTGGSVDDAAAGGGAGEAAGQRAVEGDCPICFDAMRVGGEPVSWCASCGNNIHAGCAKTWVDHKRSGGGAVTCVYCRAPWADGAGLAHGGGGASGGGAAAAVAAYGGYGGGYVNLAQFSEAHRGADTSLHALYPETSQWIERRRRQGRYGGRYGSRGYVRSRYEEEEEEEGEESEEDEGWGF